MWGDATVLYGLAKGGADLFVFRDKGLQTVGINNFIYDFSTFQRAARSASWFFA